MTKKLLASIILTVLCGCAQDEQSFAHWNGSMAFMTVLEDGSYSFSILRDNGTDAIYKKVSHHSASVISLLPDRQHLTYGYSDELYPSYGTAITDIQGNLQKEFALIDGSLAWLPDNSGFIVGKYMDGMFFVDMSDNRRRLFTSWSSTFDHCPNFSLDGQWTYYIHHEYGSLVTLYKIETATLMAGGLRGSDASGRAENIGKITTLVHDEEVVIRPHPYNTGQIILVYSGKVEIYDTIAKQTVCSLEKSFYDLVFSPDGTKMALVMRSTIGGEYTTEIISAADLSISQIIKYPIPDFFPTNVAWSPEGDALAYSAYGYTDDDAVAIYIYRFADPRLQKVWSKSKYFTSRITRVLWLAD